MAPIKVVKCMYSIELLPSIVCFRHPTMAGSQVGLVEGESLRAQQLPTFPVAVIQIMLCLGQIGRMSWLVGCPYIVKNAST